MRTASIRVRRAQSGDSEAAADLVVASRLASEPAIPPLVHSPAEVRDWFARVVVREMELWVAETASDNRLVGVMAVRGDTIEQLYVLPGWTGQGIGRQLLTVAKDQGHSSLELWAFQSNVRARRFYEREGFRVVEATDGAANEERAPDVRLRWEP